MSDPAVASYRELDGPPHHHHHHHLPNPNPLVNVVLAGCAYEIVATGVNAWLDEPVLPLLSNGVKAFTWGAFGRRLVPAWALPAALVSVGFVAAVVVVGPRQRRRAQKLVHDVGGTSAR